MRYHVTLKTGRFLTQILLMRSVRLWDPTSLQDTMLRVTVGWYLKYFCDKRLFVKLPPCQWPKFGLRAVKWLIKRYWTNFAFCFSVCIAVFGKQANIRCSVGSILRPHPLMITMQRIWQLQWTDTMDTSENLKISFL